MVIATIYHAVNAVDTYYLVIGRWVSFSYTYQYVLYIYRFIIRENTRK
jgi:hypothetical protein